MPDKKRRKRPEEVSCCLQFWVFGFNVTFWLFGCLLIGLGIWAWSERETYSYMQDISDIFIDPALIVVITGCVMFVISLVGIIGALRLSPGTLVAYSVLVILIIVLQISTSVVLFVFKDKVYDKIGGVMHKAIIKYRDNPDFQNIVDWAQYDWLRCCGVEGPSDWDKNMYFSCNGTSREACGVPFSCCLQEKYRSGDSPIVNNMCGYDTRKSPKVDSIHDYINTDGCLHASSEWLNSNVVILASVALAIACIEILGICFAMNLRADILD